MYYKLIFRILYSDCRYLQKRFLRLSTPFLIDLIEIPAEEQVNWLHSTWPLVLTDWVVKSHLSQSFNIKGTFCNKANLKNILVCCLLTHPPLYPSQ